MQQQQQQQLMRQLLLNYNINSNIRDVGRATQKALQGRQDSDGGNSKKRGPNKKTTASRSAHQHEPKVYMLD